MRHDSLSDAAHFSHRTWYPPLPCENPAFLCVNNTKVPKFHGNKTQCCSDKGLWLDPPLPQKGLN